MLILLIFCITVNFALFLDLSIRPLSNVVHGALVPIHSLIFSGWSYYTWMVHVIPPTVFSILPDQQLQISAISGSLSTPSFGINFIFKSVLVFFSQRYFHRYFNSDCVVT